MRTIKFRGKTVFGDRWVYGGILQSESRIYIIEPSVSIIDSKLNKINPDTVGQFTGFYDNAGNEIYEDDIIELMKEYASEEGGRRYAALFNPITNQISYRPINEDEKNVIHKTLWWLNASHCFKVVGNIHDNPELLEGGER